MFTNIFTDNLRPLKIKERTEKAFDFSWTFVSKKVAEEAVQIIRGEIQRSFLDWSPTEEQVTMFPSVLAEARTFIEAYAGSIMYKLDDKERTVEIFIDPEFFEKTGVTRDLLASFEFGTEDVPLRIHWRSAAEQYKNTFREERTVFAKKALEALRRAR